jgi:hypothetical protein
LINADEGIDEGGGKMEGIKSIGSRLNGKWHAYLAGRPMILREESRRKFFTTV